MANNRSAIRAALKQILEHADTAAGDSVFTNRENPLWKSELPAIIINSNEENAVPENLSGSRYYRTYELSLLVKIEATATTDDDLDDLVSDVEDAIQSDRSLSGTVLSTQLLRTGIHIDVDGEKPIGVATLTYQCKYIS